VELLNNFVLVSLRTKSGTIKLKITIKSWIRYHYRDCVTSSEVARSGTVRIVGKALVMASGETHLK
jgi:hypothetical protein